jgi:hypothetical protein
MIVARYGDIESHKVSFRNRLIPKMLLKMAVIAAKIAKTIAHLIHPDADSCRPDLRNRP